MKENFKVGIKGEVNIIQGGKDLLKQSNRITNKALGILLYAMSSAVTNNSIDSINFTYEAGSFSKPILAVEVNPEGGYIVFVTKILATDFSGTITGVSLDMSSYPGGTYSIAVKDDISVIKNDTLDMEVRWKISLVLANDPEEETEIIPT